MVVQPFCAECYEAASVVCRCHACDARVEAGQGRTFRSCDAHRGDVAVRHRDEWGTEPEWAPPSPLRSLQTD